MEVLLDNHILDRVHGRFEQGRVGSVCIMNVDFTIRDPVDPTESVRKISCGCVEIGIGTGVIREVLRYRGNGEFPLEKIDLIEEQDDRLALEPFPIDQGLEKHHRFVHLILAVDRG